jgi:hypothetical protein
MGRSKQGLGALFPVVLAGVVFAATCQAAEAGVIAAPVSPLSLDDCLRSAACWGLTKQAFVMDFKTRLHEIEGADPGRFFDKTMVYALGDMDQDHHFTRVSCFTSASQTTPCPQFRDAMENRIVSMCLLESLPIETPHDALFDPRTWEIRSLGKEYLQKVKKRRPRCWSEIAVLVSQNVKDSIPQP